MAPSVVHNRCVHVCAGVGDMGGGTEDPHQLPVTQGTLFNPLCSLYQRETSSQHTAPPVLPEDLTLKYAPAAKHP